MKYFLVGGAPNTGKTETIHRISNWLINDRSFQLVNGEIPDSHSEDFTCILQGETRNGHLIRLIINSLSDIQRCIINLKWWIQSNSDVTIVITSIRDGGDWMRDEMLAQLEIDTEMPNVFEFPLAKITRRSKWESAIRWYNNSTWTLIQSQLQRPPFDL